MPREPTQGPAASRPYPYSEEELQRELDKKFALYETLKPGWDFYSADPLNKESMADAKAFLEKRPKGIPLPFPQLGPDGTVGLYWRTSRMYISVGFDGNSLLSYYIHQAAPDGTTRRFLDDDLPFKDRWPPKLLEKLREL